MPPKIFIVEGNIAAGKSTYISKLCSDVVHVAEPIDEWQKTGIFQLYNTDPVTNAYKFQTYAFTTRIQSFLREYEKHGPDATYLLERSWHSDRLFARANYEAGYFTEMEWKMYNDWCDMHEKLVPFEVTGFIYLKTSAEVCYDRLHKRHRSTEELLKLSYLESLEKAHDEFFKLRSHLLIANNIDDDTSNTALIDAYLSSSINTLVVKPIVLEECAWRTLEFVESALEPRDEPLKEKVARIYETDAIGISEEIKLIDNVQVKIKLAGIIVYILCLLAKGGGKDSPFLAKIVSNLKAFTPFYQGARREEWLVRLEKLSSLVSSDQKLSAEDINFALLCLESLSGQQGYPLPGIFYNYLLQDTVD